jgi:hypothetical protein
VHIRCCDMSPGQGASIGAVGHEAPWTASVQRILSMAHPVFSNATQAEMHTGMSMFCCVSLLVYFAPSIVLNIPAATYRR